MTPTQSLCSRHAELPASSFPCCICWEQRWALLESTTSNQAGCKAPRTSMPRRHSYSGDRGATAKTRSMRSQDSTQHTRTSLTHTYACDRIQTRKPSPQGPHHKTHETQTTQVHVCSAPCLSIPQKRQASIFVSGFFKVNIFLRPRKQTRRKQ